MYSTLTEKSNASLSVLTNHNTWTHMIQGQITLTTKAQIFFNPYMTINFFMSVHTLKKFSAPTKVSN